MFSDNSVNSTITDFNTTVKIQLHSFSSLCFRLDFFSSTQFRLNITETFLTDSDADAALLTQWWCYLSDARAGPCLVEGNTWCRKSLSSFSFTIPETDRHTERDRQSSVISLLSITQYMTEEEGDLSCLSPNQIHNVMFCSNSLKKISWNMDQVTISCSDHSNISWNRTTVTEPFTAPLCWWHHLDITPVNRRAQRPTLHH